MTEAEIRDIVAEHVARNAALLRTLETKQVSLSTKRPIDHHFWATGQNQAALLAKELYDEGYLVSQISPVNTDDNSIVWNVEATAHQTPLEVTATQMVEKLTRLAAQFESVYDGWGTSI